MVVLLADLNLVYNETGVDVFLDLNVFNPREC